MNSNQLKYILQNFALVYNLEDINQIDLELAIDSKSKIVVLKELNNISETPIRTAWKDINIPFLYNNFLKHEIISQQNGQTIINYDILSPIFHLLSGKQEIDCKTKDKYNRFEYKNSLQYKFGFTDIPLVNYYFDILKTAIELAYGIKLEFRHKFTTCLTHDIDEVNSAWKHRIRIALENKKYLKATTNFLKHLIKPFYPWQNINEILFLEEKLKVNSTFFFLTNHNKIDKIKNADYQLKEKYIQNIMCNIKSVNSEIALHGSYKTHDNLKKIKHDLTFLNQETKGNRFHFLQWEMGKTPLIIEKSELAYDTTLGFQEQIGFRNGICTPFYLYNFKDEKAYNFLEIPLNIMDCSLAFENYMNINSKNVIKTITPMINEIKKFEGALTINWHNTFFSDYTNKNWGEIYTEIINICKAKNSIFVTCEEITKIYNN